MNIFDLKSALNSIPGIAVSAENDPRKRCVVIVNDGVQGETPVGFWIPVDDSGNIVLTGTEVSPIYAEGAERIFERHAAELSYCMGALNPETHYNDLLVGDFKDCHGLVSFPFPNGVTCIVTASGVIGDVALSAGGAYLVRNGRIWIPAARA